MDFEFTVTQQFVEDTSPIEQFDPYQYTQLDESFNKELTDEEKQNAVTVPLKITSFPWNVKFEGIVFMIGKVGIDENDDDTASLEYNYTVVSNPNELELALSEEETSKRTEDNELLDVFIGRLVESLLHKMSNDDNFLEEMGKRGNQ